MEYNPKEVEQAEKEFKERMNTQLADGVYDAECIEGKNDVSKAGNDMIVLNWTVFGHNGETVRVRDYITANAQWKLKQVMQGCGMDTETGRTIEAEEFIGKSAKVSIVKDGEYNKIKAYVAAGVKAELDDALPF